MNKKIKKIIATTILGGSLAVLGATTIAPVSASAYSQVYDQNTLGMQTIYRENGYAIAKVNVSEEALKEGVSMHLLTSNTSGYYEYFAPEHVGTDYYYNNSEVTVERNDNKYVVTFKINLDSFGTSSNIKAEFNAGKYAFNCVTYVDNNGGHYYTV